LVCEARALNIVPDERGKDYCSEAVRIMVDYLFLSKTLDRIQARTDTRNLFPESFGKDRFQKGARAIDKFLQASQLC
jgi:hypothetical protein